MKRAIPLIMLLALTMACAKQIRPGAIDKLDSSTYDTLLVAQGLLDATKVSILQGKLPDSAKPIVNQAGMVYDQARNLWLLYRANPNQDTAKLVIDATAQLNTFIAQLRGLGGAK
jgi:hypothetical protein